jgi:hypothetical protein
VRSTVADICLSHALSHPLSRMQYRMLATAASVSGITAPRLQREERRGGGGREGGREGGEEQDKAGGSSEKKEFFGVTKAM